MIVSTRIAFTALAGAVAVLLATTVPAGGTPMSSMESAMFDAINAERVANGVEPLAFDIRLFEAADFHSEEMATNDFFSHDSLDGATSVERAESFGYPTSSGFGELIAAGQETPQPAVDQWLAGGGTSALLLDPSLKGLGVGHSFDATSTFGHYWTADFGGAEPVPEPSTVAMLAVGLTGLAVLASRRRPAR